MELHKNGDKICKIIGTLPTQDQSGLKQLDSSTPLVARDIRQMILPKNSGLHISRDGQYAIVHHHQPNQAIEFLGSVVTVGDNDVVKYRAA